MDIAAIADEQAAALAAAFLVEIARAQSVVNMTALAAAIEAGDAAAALAALEIEGETLPDLETDLSDTSTEAAFAAILALITVNATVTTLTNVRTRTVTGALAGNPPAPLQVRVPSSSDAAPDLSPVSKDAVREIASDTATALKDTVSRITSGRMGPASAYAHARHLRENIGLNANQAQAVDNFAAQLRKRTNRPGGIRIAPAAMRRLNASERARVRKHLKDGHLSETQIEELVDAYRTRLRNQRALTIAQTESLRAANAGENQAWEQAADEGVIDRSTVRRFWVTAGDERVRESHRRIPGMNPEGRALGEPFATPDGKVMFPPAGPNCRCRVRLGGNNV